MKLEYLERAFESIGARLRVEVQEPVRNWANVLIPADYSPDIGHDRRGQFFALRGSEVRLAEADFFLLNKQKSDRHLLLLVKGADYKRKDRFLCGHDEREWFVAAVPGNASTVVQAKEALKPAPVRAAQARKGLNSIEANTRRNPAFRRQGEWFFVPVERPLLVDPMFVLRNEPISRGIRSKPHIVEKLYRSGGEIVHVNHHYPQGITQAQYRKLIQRTPGAKKLGWRQMRRNPGVYAIGAVRHPDHETLVLTQWCQVLMNEEGRAPSRNSVAFLD
jgi:hypothetical protein